MTEYNTLRGADKAAMLLLALGDEHAANIFEAMDDEEIKEISQVMATLGGVQSTVVERVLVEFTDQMSATGSLVGSFESTERLLTKAESRESHEDV